MMLRPYRTELNWEIYYVYLCFDGWMEITLDSLGSVLISGQADASYQDTTVEQMKNDLERKKIQPCCGYSK